MDNNDLTLEAVVDQLRKLAPDKNRNLALSTVSRHAAGAVIPSPEMQDLYLQLTGAAVTPNDWFALSKNPELGKRADKPKEAA